MIIILSLITLIVALAYAVFIPGIERKVHARIQQRFGPPITTPGLWNILKFAFKKRIKPNSPNPQLYHGFIILALVAVAFTLLFSTPGWWSVLGFASILGLAGMLKIEEASYLLMGCFSKSVMSVGMPWSDRIKNARFTDVVRQSFGEFGAVRALKMITLGSFPFYVALFHPFATAATMSIKDVLSTTPAILSVSGLIAAFVYFIGYNILTNNRPFDIIKPKVDIIEGPLMEYAALWRGLYYLLTGFLSFTLSSVFITLFLGIPLDVTAPSTLLLHLILIPILPIGAAVLKAFSPVFTFKQIYYVSFSSTLLGALAIALAMVGL